MDRVLVLEKMFEIANFISNYKKEILELEDKKIELFIKVNELKLRYTLDVSKDKELKNNEMREAKVKDLVMQNEEIQKMYKEINPIARKIDILKIDVENMELKYKSYKYAFGSVVL